jgi:hypothetical protein
MLADVLRRCKIGEAVDAGEGRGREWTRAEGLIITHMQTVAQSIQKMFKCINVQAYTK